MLFVFSTRDPAFAVAAPDQSALQSMQKAMHTLAVLFAATAICVFSLPPSLASCFCFLERTEINQDGFFAFGNVCPLFLPASKFPALFTFGGCCFCDF